MADDPTTEQRINNILEERGGLLDKIVKQEFEATKQIGEYLTKKEKSFKLDQKRADLAAELEKFATLDADKQTELSKALETRIAKAKELETLSKDELDLLQLKAELQLSIKAGSEEETRTILAQLKAQQDLVDAREELRDIAKEDVETLKEGLGVITGFAGMVSTSTTAFGKMGGAIGASVKLLANGEADLERMAATAAASFADVGMGTILARTEEVMMAQDRLVSGFLKQTGASQATADAVFQASDSLRSMGLDMDSAGEAAVSLYNNVTAFKDASVEAQASTIEFVGMMEELGIRADTVTDVMQHLTLGLRMTLPEAKAVTKEMRDFAITMDINVNQALEDFAEHADELIAHGPRMTEVFKDLQLQSRQTGISMDRLMSIAGQFDTFEDAATTVGRLNGLLGGAYLNSVDMLYKTEAERNEEMKRALDMSGKSFDTLSRYEQKALAAAGGFRSVGEAANFFNSALENPEAVEQRKRQESLANQAKLMKTIFERLQLAMNSFAISMRPAIEFLGHLIDGIVYLNDATGGFIGKFLIAVGVVHQLRKGMQALAAITGISTLATGANTAAQAANTSTQAAARTGLIAYIGTLVTSIKAKIASAAMAVAGALGPFGIPLAIAAATAGIAGMMKLVGAFQFGSDSVPASGMAMMGEGGKPELHVGSGGASIVGGPSIRPVTKGDKVISNKNLQKLGGGPSIGELKTAFKQALSEHQASLDAKAGPRGGTAGAKQMQVNLKVRERELAKTVIDILEDNYSIKLSPTT